MIAGLENRSVLDLARELDQGGRFVVYPYCVSLLVITLRLNSGVQYVPPGHSPAAKGLPYVIATLLLGWWGIPWGPIFSIAALAESLGGGRDVTFEVRMALQNEPSFQAAREFDAHVAAAERAKITAQDFSRAAARLLAYGIAANDHADSEEMAYASRLCWELFGEILGKNELDSILRIESQEPNWKLVLPQVCIELRKLASADERRTLLSLVAKLMLVDGKFSASEKAYFTSVGKHLGLEMDDIRLVFETEKTQFLGSDSSLAMRQRKARVVLGLQENASDEEVKKRYRKLALKYHPDRVSHLGSKIQAEAQRSFSKITEARDILLGAQ
ncbi:MAG: DnaJ domain-containing protein [Planctomycetes bacterium]|nr:DnaJ domain-containing protein [Planctomycetota bacterium]